MLTLTRLRWIAKHIELLSDQFRIPLPCPALLTISTLIRHCLLQIRQQLIRPAQTLLHWSVRLLRSTARKVVEDIMVIVDRQTNRFQIVLRLRPPSCLSCLLDRRQQQCHQHTAHRTSRQIAHRCPRNTLPSLPGIPALSRITHRHIRKHRLQHRLRRRHVLQTKRQLHPLTQIRQHLRIQHQQCHRQCLKHLPISGHRIRYRN